MSCFRPTLISFLSWLRTNFQFAPKTIMTDCCNSLKAAISVTWSDCGLLQPYHAWCFFHVSRAVRKHALTHVSASPNNLVVLARINLTCPDFRPVRLMPKDFILHSFKLHIHHFPRPLLLALLKSFQELTRALSNTSSFNGCQMLSTGLIVTQSPIIKAYIQITMSRVGTVT